MNTKSLFLFLLCLAFFSCTSPPVGPLVGSGPVPGTFFINQNYPNPFKDSTRIPYGVPNNGGYVALQIFDKYYTPVRVLALNYSHPAGSWETIWDGRDADYKKVPPGIYIIELYGSSPNTFISRITAVKTK